MLRERAALGRGGGLLLVTLGAVSCSKPLAPTRSSAPVDASAQAAPARGEPVSVQVEPVGPPASQEDPAGGVTAKTPEESVAAPESADPGRLEGVKTLLDDGSYVLIPYGDQGLDTCAMMHVQVDGTRTPHRPPDARARCSAAWAKQDADAAR